MCCDIYIPRYTRIFPIFTMGWLGLFVVTVECTYMHTHIFLPTYEFGWAICFRFSFFGKYGRYLIWRCSYWLSLTFMLTFT